MDKGTDRAALIQKDKDAPLPDAKSNAGGCRQTACPLHQLDDLAQHNRAHSVSENARIHKNRHRLVHCCRGDLFTRDHTTRCQKPVSKRCRVNQIANRRQIAQILCDSNARATRCLIRAEISELARIQTTWPLELHACVKLQDNTTAVGEKIHVGQAGEGLENTRLILSNAAAPLALESAHESIRDEILAHHPSQIS